MGITAVVGFSQASHPSSNSKYNLEHWYRRGGEGKMSFLRWYSRHTMVYPDRHNGVKTKVGPFCLTKHYIDWRMVNSPLGSTDYNLARQRT